MTFAVVVILLVPRLLLAVLKMRSANGSLSSRPADLDGHVDELGELACQRRERGQLCGGVSRVDRGQAERLGKERVVVVDVSRHVGVGSRGGRLRNK